MRIGIVSDSHGNLYMLDKAIETLGSIDMIIHLGDCYRDIIKVNEKYNLPIEYVPGNNDYSGTLEGEKTIDILGKKIFITHGHKYGIYTSIESLYFKALELGVDAVLYGHTHRQSLDRSGEIIYLNPGSTSYPRDTGPGAAVLTIDDDDIDVELYRIEY